MSGIDNRKELTFATRMGAPSPRNKRGYSMSTKTGNSEKSFVATLILCILFGSLGVHRFYVGKVGTGILMLLTFGGLEIWTLVDIIVIAVGNFKDSNGLPIKS